jgi:hypothetical protein
MPRVDAFLQKHKDRWGVKIVSVLQNYPDEPVHVLQLSHMIEPPAYQGLSPEQVDQLIFKADDIPMTDRTTLRQANRELNRQIKIKEARQKAGLPCDDQDFIIAWLIAYHKGTTRPNGTIKPFRGNAEKEYQRHQAAVRRLLDKAKIECPEAWGYITTHLKMGIYFAWLSDQYAAAGVNPSLDSFYNKSQMTSCRRRC